MSYQIARMSISTVITEKLSLCIFLLLLGMAVTTSKPQANREDECFYYFIQQPSSNVCCNPWPYIEIYSGNTLVLHCDLLSPQNNNIPTVEWYRIPHSEVDSKSQRLHHSRRGKYSTPTSSGDISNGLKRINFTLFVNDVNETDAGCYWCEIRATGKCSSPLKQSSVFCLRKVRAYGDSENCPILPVNSSVVCASDGLCDELPDTWLGDPYLTTTKSDKPMQMPPAMQTNSDAGTMLSAHHRSINSTVSPSRSLHASQRSPEALFTTHSIQPTISSDCQQHAPVTNKICITPTASSSDSASTLASHQNSPLAAYYRTKAIALSPSSSIHISKSANSELATVVQSSSVVAVGNELERNGTKELPLHLTLVQISVFIGIGVCTVLFAVISVLVFGVVMLCKKTTPSTPARTYHMHIEGEGRQPFSNSPAELLSTVWRRELETSPVPMSVVNTEHAALPPSSAPSYSSVRIAVNEGDQNPSHPQPQDQPMTSPALPPTSPMMSVPMPTLPSHMNAESRWRAYSLPLLSERTSGTINQLRQHNQHHLSLVGNRESRLDYQQIDVNNATGSVSSPELHYYHVLERPEYYNCIWLEGEDGHELLLGQAKRSNRQRVTIKEDDSESDSEYHWRVVLTSGQDEGENLDRSTSSKRVGRHLYRRLDHSTLEPFQDYAKVSIASGHQDSDGTHMHYSQ